MAAFDIKSVFQPAKIYGGTTGFAQLASDIISLLTYTAAALSLIFIIIGGIRLVTSGGDPKKLQAAGATISYAIIGLSVTILAFLILRIIQFFFISNVPIT